MLERVRSRAVGSGQRLPVIVLSVQVVVEIDAPIGETMLVGTPEAVTVGIEPFRTMNVAGQKHASLERFQTQAAT